MYSWTIAHFNTQTCWKDILTINFYFQDEDPETSWMLIEESDLIAVFSQFPFDAIFKHLLKMDPNTPSKEWLKIRCFLNTSMNSFTFPLLCTLSIVALQDAVQCLCSVQFCYTLFCAINNCVFACWRVIRLSLLRCQTKGYNCLPLYVIKMVSLCKSQLYIIS